MAGLFSPSMPAMQPPPPVPQVDQATIDREAMDLARKRRGRAATQITGNAGPIGADSLAVKQLLGS
jgi:hypothetical protein